MDIIGATSHSKAINRPDVQNHATTANTILLLVVVMGIHTAFSLSFLPHQFLAFLAAVGLFIVNHRSFSVALSLGYITAFLVVATVGFFSSSSGDVDHLGNFRASLNFMYDLFIGLNVYFAISNLGRARMRKIFLYLLVFLIVGAALEVVGIVKPLSDAFRESTFATGLYTRNERDLEIYGSIRPKFFSAEPAGLGETMSISFFFWMTSVDRMKFSTEILSFILLLMCFYLVRSPIMVFGLIAVGLYYSMVDPPDGWLMRRLSKIFVLGYAVVAFSTPAIVNGMLVNSMEVPEYISAGSFYARVIAPFYMAAEALWSYPLFGIGLAISDTFVQMAIDAYAATGRLYEIPFVAWDTLAANSCSAFWYTFIAFGFVGVAGLIIALKMIFRAMKIRVSLMLVIFIAGTTFWLTFGRVNSPIAWETFFGIAAICDLGLKARAARQPQRRASRPPVLGAMFPAR